MPSQKVNQNYQKGSGLFSSSPKGNQQYQLFHKAKASEKELFKILKEYRKLTDKYYKKYQQHIENLINLDESFVGVDSFRKSFELLFNSEDKDNLDQQALLLRNYSDLESFYEVDDMLKYHLIQQITYLLTKAYSDQDRFLIRQITLQNVMKNPEMMVVTVDGRNTGFFQIPHEKYNLDYGQMKAILDQVIDQMRKTLNKDSQGTPIFPKADLKPGTLIGLKESDSPHNIPVIESKSKKDEPKVNSKEDSKVDSKVDSKEEKKLENVKVPEGQYALPVFKIDIPQKATPKPSPKPPSRKKSARKSKPKSKGKTKGKSKGNK